LRQPVAIFLNDGHGNFSRAEPTAFPGAFSESKTNWVSGSSLTTDAVGMASQSGAGVCAEDSVFECGFSGQSFLSFPAGARPSFRSSPLLIARLFDP
jgi:hypothetical protein